MGAWFCICGRRAVSVVGTHHTGLKAMCAFHKREFVFDHPGAEIYPILGERIVNRAPSLNNIVMEKLGRETPKSTQSSDQGAERVAVRVKTA